MPLVPTIPAVTGSGSGEASRHPGVGRECPSQSDGFVPGERGARASGARAGPPASLRAPGRGPVPPPTPAPPSRAPAGESRGRGVPAAAERPVPGGRGKRRAAAQARVGPGGAPGHGEAARLGGRTRAPGPAAERRSPWPERPGRPQLGGRESSNARPRSSGSARPRRAASRHAEVCPSLLGLIVLARFLSSPPRGSPARPARPPPPSLPLPSPPSPPPPGLPPLPTPGSSLAPTLSFSHTHTQDTLSPSPRSCSVSPSPSSLRFGLPCNLLKCCPSPDFSASRRAAAPARSPAPSLARFLSLALPLPHLRLH